MPQALLRPGRIDRVLYVPLPDVDTRKKIFEVLYEVNAYLNGHIPVRGAQYYVTLL